MVDEKNPAPVEVGSFFTLFTRFYTSQVVQDSFHQQELNRLEQLVSNKDICSAQKQLRRSITMGKSQHN